MNIYLNIKSILDKKKILQKDVAQTLGVNKNTVINWFKNEKGIRAEQVPAIAKILHVSISELYGEENTVSASVPKLTSKEQGKVELLKEQLKEERDENRRLALENDRLKTKVPSKV